MNIFVRALLSLIPAIALSVPSAVATPTNHQPSTTVSGTATAARVTPSQNNCYNTAQFVQLTFDDTATTDNLRRILATLKKNNVKATFFFNTSTTSEAKFKMIRDAGMNIGNHTYNHPQLSKLSASAVRSQIVRGRSKYTNTNLVRPPFGATNSTVKSVIQSLGYRQCLWNVDTRDWSSATSKTLIIKRVKYGDKTTPPAKAGSVVLMHGTKTKTADALQGVIDAVRSRGLKLQPLR